MNLEYESYKTEAQASMDKAIQFLKDEFNRLKAGRASIVMVEDIVFEAYGQTTTIKHSSALSVPDPHQIVIEPWDKSLLCITSNSFWKNIRYSTSYHRML